MGLLEKSRRALGRSFRIPLAGLAVGLLVLGASGGSANALEVNAVKSSAQLSATAEASIRASYDRMGVTKVDQDRVIAKFVSGVLPESVTGGTVVSSSTENKDGYSQTVKHFLDGSASLTKIEVPSEQQSPSVSGTDSITGCQSYPGAGYYNVTNCRVATDQAFFSVWFYADLHEGTGGNLYSSIENLRGLGGSSVAGTLSNPNLFLVGQQSSFGEAKATGQYNFEAPFVSGYAAVTLHLSYTNAWDTSP